jgi:hypothetical protein
MTLKPFAFALALTALAPAARAEEPGAPILMRVEIAGRDHTDSHAVYVAPDGDAGVVGVEGRATTHLKLQLHTRARPGVSFEVRRIGEDKTMWTARGDAALPQAGKKLVVGRVPQPGGDVEIRLSVAP